MEVETAVQAYAQSMPDPNVQEMVMKDPFLVPERYIRSNRPHDKDVSCLSQQIPVLDLLLLSNGDKEELEKLNQACKDWGFFQVINHGVEISVLQDMKDAAAAFFELPLEEKNKFALNSMKTQGYGEFSFSEDQKLDWCDALMLAIYPTHRRLLEYWPKTPEGFKKIVEAFSDGIRQVGEEILRSISVVMKMDKNTLLHLHKEVIQVLKVNYYPACSRPDDVYGLSPHRDFTSISIVMQEDDVGGLQVKHKGEWVQANPIPNALVVNVGDVIEMWSNGKYKSIEHRVIPNRNKARISYATFLYPDSDVELEPLDHMVDDKPLYKKIRIGDHQRLSHESLRQKAPRPSTKLEI